MRLHPQTRKFTVKQKRTERNDRGKNDNQTCRGGHKQR